MAKLLAALFLLVIPLSETVKTAQNPAPDLTGWIQEPVSRVEITVSDSIHVSLGIEVEYKNPANPNEFVRVIAKHVPLVVREQRMPNNRLISEVMLSMYAERDVNELLGKLSKESDPIIFMRWHVKKDPKTGRDAQDGDTEVWFRKNEGDWIFDKNREVLVEFISENVTNGHNRNVMVGRKYSMNGAYHIFKADRKDIVKAMEEK